MLSAFGSPNVLIGAVAGVWALQALTRRPHQRTFGVRGVPWARAVGNGDAVRIAARRSTAPTGTLNIVPIVSNRGSGCTMRRTLGRLCGKTLSSRPPFQKRLMACGSRLDRHVQYRFEQ